MKNINEKISGWYPELKDKVQELLDIGFTNSSISKVAGIPNTNIAKWVCGDRPLNHSYATKIEEAIVSIKERVSQI